MNADEWLSYASDCPLMVKINSNFYCSNLSFVLADKEEHRCTQLLGTHKCPRIQGTLGEPRGLNTWTGGLP